MQRPVTQGPVTPSPVTQRTQLMAAYRQTAEHAPPSFSQPTPAPSAGSSADPMLIVWQGDHRWLRTAVERIPDQADIQDDPVVVVDCRNVEVLRSEHLSTLIQIRMWLQARGYGLRIDNVRPAAMELLQLTRLDRMLQIQPAG
jgi:anti-anti-sigma regulatory factor